MAGWVRGSEHMPHRLCGVHTTQPKCVGAGGRGVGRVWILLVELKNTKLSISFFYWILIPYWSNLDVLSARAFFKSSDCQDSDFSKGTTSQSRSCISCITLRNFAVPESIIFVL